MLTSATKRGLLPDLAASGLMVIERGGAIGGGQLGRYAITSDSTADTFLSSVRDNIHPELARLVDHPAGRAVAAHQNALGVPLAEVGPLLRATGDRLTDETGPTGQGFLAEVCRRWEASTAAAEQAGARVAHLRTGIVLSGQGGALKKQLPVFKAGAGAPLGSGRQYVPWISLHDEVAAIVHLLTADVRGPVNLVGPAPVTNREFTKALGRAVHRPTLPIAVPGFVLKAGLGDFAQEGVLTGQRLVPSVLDRSGFVFAHRTVDEALLASL